MSYIKKNEMLLHEKRNDLAVFVAKFYLICLTFKMIAPLRFLESIIGGAAISFDIIPHFCGVFIILINNKGKLPIYDDEEGNILSFFFQNGYLVFHFISNNGYNNTTAIWKSWQ